MACQQQDSLVLGVAACLESAAHAQKPLGARVRAVAVLFYIGVTINTTTLERNLSQLLTQLHAHSGPLEESGATMASILEVASEGPKTESEFFQQAEAGSENGQLVPTEFAVKCAQLWIQCFGRRFRASYRIGKPTKEAAAGHLPGTLVSVITGRAAAAHAASQAAASAEVRECTWRPASFVGNLALPLRNESTSAASLQGSRWGQPVAGSAAIHLSAFHKHTKRKLERSSPDCFVCDEYPFGQP